MRSLIVPALLATAPAVAHPDPGAISWGKAGVSFDQYRADAIMCGRLGANMDVSGTEAVKVFRHASAQYETITETGPPNQDNGAPQNVDIPVGQAGGYKIDQGAINSVEVSTRLGWLVAATRPKERIAEVGALMRARVEQCLTGFGYHRFRLSADQQHALGKLRHGSDARQDYLYRLASDPRVLGEQGVD